MGIMRTKRQGILKDSIDKPEVNEGHYPELLDRVWVTMDNINNNLLEHPLAYHEDEVKKLIEDAMDNLWDAYQTLGSKMDKSE
jgi:hypothetical protein